ncbi:hypothetical protein [Photobacterium damselae]|uniref:hypothetical protein n=1 Tax=Photobacterium damselae TaxID=38293 RepID=UPI001F422070|nr:hypothetical protein [Photobacterium damselae]UKA04719.1 hypothetical protein IHC89_20990 [Photobacterium damselae subsp. damselae]
MAATSGIILSGIMGVIYVGAFLSGCYLTWRVIHGIATFDQLKRSSTNPIGQLITKMVIAGMLLAPSFTVRMGSGTLGLTSGNNDFCYAFSSDLSSVASDSATKRILQYSQSGDCFKSATSEYVSKLTDKLEESQKGAVESLLVGKFRVVIGIFQTIAAYFFFTAWFTITKISDGTERQSTYSKQAVIIIISILFINMPSLVGWGYDFISWLSGSNGLGDGTSSFGAV